MYLKCEGISFSCALETENVSISINNGSATHWEGKCPLKFHVLPGTLYGNSVVADVY